MPADINNVVLFGRLTRDAELKYTVSGQAVCKFSIAVNRVKKNGDQWEEEANFFDIVLWGKRGEALNQYLLKGKSVGIQGELRQDRWQQDGQNRSKVEIIANNIQLVGGISGGQGSGSGNQGSYSNNRSEGAYSDNAPHGSPPVRDDHFTDDIPF
ncbi:MAG: single-stranded DNA-binding protein [Treponema sp.]|nr:single-stranded DNA-binding protein [Treponema sp.]